MQHLMNIHEIVNHLPHRYPFLMVDRIIEYIPHERLVGLKNVTINEPFFQGHFPNFPIMPGVMILESLGQTGAIFAYESAFMGNTEKLIFLTGFDKVRFRRPVIPGDQLLLDLTLIQKRSTAIKMYGKATVEGELAAEAQIMAVLQK